MTKVAERLETFRVGSPEAAETATGGTEAPASANLPPTAAAH